MLLLVVLVLGGCSWATQLAYNNLDWLVNRELGEYIDLDRAQQDAFDADFGPWWRWHRQTQLPVYASELRQWEQHSRTKLSDQDFLSLFDKAITLYRATIAAGVPLAADGLRQLSDEQVDDFLQRLRDRADEFESENVKPGVDRRTARRIKRTRKFLRRQLGSLDTAQKARVQRWAETRIESDELWLQSRHRWIDAMKNALDDRRDPDFERILHRLLVDNDSLWTDEHRRTAEANLRGWATMLADVFNSRSDTQVRHYSKYVLGYADVFEELAIQSP